MAPPQATETGGKTTNLFHKCYLFPYNLEVIFDHLVRKNRMVSQSGHNEIDEKAN